VTYFVYPCTNARDHFAVRMQHELDLPLLLEKQAALACSVGMGKVQYY
jgi:hypothetical protein